MGDIVDGSLRRIKDHGGTGRVYYEGDKDMPDYIAQMFEAGFEHPRDEDGIFIPNQIAGMFTLPEAPPILQPSAAVRADRKAREVHTPSYPPSEYPKLGAIFGIDLGEFRPSWWERGCTRECFLLGRYAIKIPSLHSWRAFVMGLLANMQERDWSGYSPKLCPVLFAVPGGFLSIMPRCRPLTGPEWDTVSQEFMAGLPGELKRSSFGVLDGRIVLLDYGN